MSFSTSFGSNADFSVGPSSLPTPLGKIIGSYEIKENIAQFEISEKPFFVNCNLIESKLKEFITLTV